VYFTTAERTNLFYYRFGTPAQTSVTHLTADAILFNGGFFIPEILRERGYL
jgi:hypothetical protein